MNREPFITPEGYFDELPAKIQSRCIIKTENKKHHVFNRMIPYAAVLIPLVIVFSYLINRPSVISTDAGSGTDRYFEEVSYLADVQGIDEDDIVEFMTGSETDDDSNIRQDEIIDYVNKETDNYLDIFDLMN